jgi:hypothetical protein
LIAGTKKPVSDRLFGQPGNAPQSLLQCAHLLTETAFVAGRFVLVDQTFAGRFVDDGKSPLVGRSSRLRITSGDRSEDLLNMGSQRGALAGIALPAVFRLTGTLAGLSRVRQSLSPVPGTKEPGTMRISAEFVNAEALK